MENPSTSSVSSSQGAHILMSNPHAGFENVVGNIFSNRKQLQKSKIHNPLTMNMSIRRKGLNIILSVILDGIVDVILDQGDDIVIKGIKDKKQNEKLWGGLKNNIKYKEPIRIIRAPKKYVKVGRNFYPDTGFRYDGLYIVDLVIHEEFGRLLYCMRMDNQLTIPGFEKSTLLRSLYINHKALSQPSTNIKIDNTNTCDCTIFWTFMENSIFNCSHHIKRPCLCGNLDSPNKRVLKQIQSIPMSVAKELIDSRQTELFKMMINVMSDILISSRVEVNPNAGTKEYPRVKLESDIGCTTLPDGDDIEENASSNWLKPERDDCTPLSDNVVADANIIVNSLKPEHFMDCTLTSDNVVADANTIVNSLKPEHDMDCTLISDNVVADANTIVNSLKPEHDMDCTLISDNVDMEGCTCAKPEGDMSGEIYLPDDGGIEEVFDTHAILVEPEEDMSGDAILSDASIEDTNANRIGSEGDMARTILPDDGRITVEYIKPTESEPDCSTATSTSPACYEGSISLKLDVKERFPFDICLTILKQKMDPCQLERVQKRQRMVRKWQAIPKDTETFRGFEPTDLCS